jgi:hypothetical protein
MPIDPLSRELNATGSTLTQVATPTDCASTGRSGSPVRRTRQVHGVPTRPVTASPFCDQPLYRFGRHVFVLGPPYQVSGVVHGLSTVDDVPLGAIAIGIGEGSWIGILSQLTQAARQWPWLIPCVIMPWGLDSLERDLLLVTELRDRLVVAHTSSVAEAQRAHDAVLAVRLRTPPTPEILARWIARRLHEHSLASAVHHQFVQALQGVPASRYGSVATYSRIFAPYGPFTARDWRALASLCEYAALDTRSRCSMNRVLSPRTASQYSRKYLTLPCHAIAARIGWEWVLEQALRVARYV